MYKTLLAAGYTEHNIYVLYGWGADHSSANPNYQHSPRVTDFPATTEWVNRILKGLAKGDWTIDTEMLTANDSLFVCERQLRDELGIDVDVVTPASLRPAIRERVMQLLACAEAHAFLVTYADVLGAPAPH